MKNNKNLIKIKEEVTVGETVLEAGDRIALIIESGRVDTGKVYDTEFDNITQSIIQWFEGPRGFDNTEQNLIQIVETYKNILNDIEPYDIFADTSMM